MRSKHREPGERTASKECVDRCRNHAVIIVNPCTYCIVLCCIILYCIVSFFIVLHLSVLYCIVSYCILLYCIVFIHFYSASLSMSYLEALPTTVLILRRS